MPTDPYQGATEHHVPVMFEKLGDTFRRWNETLGQFEDFALDGGGATVEEIVWVRGFGVPDDALGADGGFYLDLDTGDVYRRSVGEYVLISNVELPDAATWREGIGLPDDGVGVYGDIYFRTTTRTTYLKTTAGWYKRVGSLTQTSIDEVPVETKRLLELYYRGIF